MEVGRGEIWTAAPSGSRVSCGQHSGSGTLATIVCYNFDIHAKTIFHKAPTCTFNNNKALLRDFSEYYENDGQ